MFSSLYRIPLFLFALSTSTMNKNNYRNNKKRNSETDEGKKIIFFCSACMQLLFSLLYAETIRWNVTIQMVHCTLYARVCLWSLIPLRILITSSYIVIIQGDNIYSRILRILVPTSCLVGQDKTRSLIFIRSDRRTDKHGHRQCWKESFLDVETRLRNAPRLPILYPAAHNASYRIIHTYVLS